MSSRLRQILPTSRCAAVGAALLLVAVAAAMTTPEARASVTPGTPVQIASGLSDVQLGGFAVARDGTGGLVYTAQSGGVTHAYLARLVSGEFSAPQQLDTGGLNGASQPVITADNGGQLLVAFVSGGGVYTEEALNSAAPLSAPVLMANGASNPSISMNLFGVGYLAYTVAAGAGDDVDVDYWSGTGWAAASPQAMNDSDGDNAGTGQGAPSVAAASDGVGIVAWGEDGHIFSRRVWGTQTSTEIEQDDLSSYGGLNEVSAQSPDVAVGGDSTYPDIVFSESFQNGSGTQTRAMLTRLVAEDTRPAVAIDGLNSAAGQNALAPQVAMGEEGRGIIADANVTGSASTTAATSSASYGVDATILGVNGYPGTPGVQASAQSAAPAAAAGVFGQISSGLAWDAGSGASSQVVVGYAADGVNLAAPVGVSTSAQGPIQSQDGLLLAGDNRGDAAAAWVQGAVDGTLTIYADQLYTPESAPGLDPATVDATTSTPTLNWNPSAEDWGSVSYAVSLNNNTFAQTTGTSAQVTSPLTDGTYSWGVQATNAVGNQETSSPGKLIVDTYAPRLRIRVTGPPRVRAVQRLTLADVDVPNPAEPGATASGIRSVSVNWGDSSATTTTRRLSLTHAYARPGLYTLSVTVSDVAGNLATLTRLIRVLA